MFSRAATTRRWARVAVLAADTRRAWDVVATGEVPPLLAAQVDGVLDDLDSAVASRSSADVRQAATELELAVLPGTGASTGAGTNRSA